MASPLAGVTEDVIQGFGNFKPEGPQDMIDFFRQLPEFWEGVADALSGLASRMEDEMPLHPSLAEQIREAAGTAAGLRDAAQETHAAFRQLHKKEIARAEEPRQGETAWDVSNLG